jgi:hypothetical protein
MPAPMFMCLRIKCFSVRVKQSYRFLVNVVELNGGRNEVKMSENIYFVECFPVSSEKIVMCFVTNH